MQIAVVGAGISGLATSHLLHRDHDVTVFEAADYVGGHTNTVEVEARDGVHAVDTGFIVYNEHNYPNFTRLLASLDVATEPSDMSFGVSSADGEIAYSSRGVRGLFAARRSWARRDHRRMVAEIPRFWRDARTFLEHGVEEITLGEFLDRGEYDRALVEYHVLPMGAAIWSTDPDRMLDYPARSLLDFFDNHGLLGLRGRPRWRVVSGGSARYVDKLIAPFAHRIRLGTPVQRISRDRLGIEIESAAGTEHYDAVVLATHADQSLRMLSDPSPDEVELLGAAGFQRNHAVLHTDASIMPRSRNAWASWNFHIGTGATESAGAPVAVTYHMNRLQNLTAADDYFVTLNYADAIDPACTIAEFDYAHPVFDAAAISAQREHKRIQGNRNTYYGGAWRGYGFHEDGVVSAVDVARALGVEPRL